MKQQKRFLPAIIILLSLFTFGCQQDDVGDLQLPLEEQVSQLVSTQNVVDLASLIASTPSEQIDPILNKYPANELTVMKAFDHIEDSGMAITIYSPETADEIKEARNEPIEKGLEMRGRRGKGHYNLTRARTQEPSDDWKMLGYSWNNCPSFFGSYIINRITLRRNGVNKNKAWSQTKLHKEDSATYENYASQSTTIFPTASPFLGDFASRMHSAGAQ